MFPAASKDRLAPERGNTTSDMWLAVDTGGLQASRTIGAGELAVFDVGVLAGLLAWSLAGYHRARRELEALQRTAPDAPRS